MNPPYNPRRTHHKRTSASRLSSDTTNTTSTLPEYTSVAWHKTDNDLPSDKPPDYSDSAEEADEDTDDSEHEVYVPPLSSPFSPPSRRKRRPAQRRPQTDPEGTDAFLDSLLERSVHALEMSNALLQSSMSTHTSLSTVLSPDSPVDRTLEARAPGLNSRMQNNSGLHNNWADDLYEISKGVDGLLGDDGRRNSAGSSMSCSLPPTSSMPNHLRARQHRRMPSLDLRTTANGDVPQLRLDTSDRTRFVSPPPRAMTQYIESTADPDSIILPSTLGLRSSPSFHSQWRTPESSSSCSLNVPSDKPFEPSSPVVDLLSSLVRRSSSSGTSTPPSSTRPPFSSLSRKGTSSASARSERGSRPHAKRKTSFPDVRRLSRSTTPKQLDTPRSNGIMTSCIEELPPSPSSSSDALPRCYRTMESLQKILDEQPAPPSMLAREQAKKLDLHRPPALLFSTSLPLSGTSTATASISRLFTKPTHSSSTRPPSPPRHSSMKRSASSTPTRNSPPQSTNSLHVAEYLGPNIIRAFSQSPPSSGRSTPKRISFAELPESYASSRPPGSLSGFKDKKGKSKQKDSSSGKDGAKSKDGASEGGGGGVGRWMTWLMGAAGTPSGYGLNAGATRSEERLDDRVTRGWGSRAGMGAGLDDWAI